MSILLDQIKAGSEIPIFHNAREIQFQAFSGFSLLLQLPQKSWATILKSYGSKTAAEASPALFCPLYLWNACCPRPCGLWVPGDRHPHAMLRYQDISKAGDPGPFLRSSPQPILLRPYLFSRIPGVSILSRSGQFLLFQSLAPPLSSYSSYTATPLRSFFLWEQKAEVFI